MGIDSNDWHVELAQRDILSSPWDVNKIKPVSYRPFDIRFTYYTGISRGLICRPRNEIMSHMLQTENLALCVIRRSRELSVSNFFVTRHLVDKTVLSSADNAHIAPLYIYLSNDKENSLFKFHQATNGTPSETDRSLNSGTSDRRPNFAPLFIDKFAASLGMTFIPDGRGDRLQTFGPEDVFHYMYAVFHSPAYRSRYAEFLKIDFPRLPLTANAGLFRSLCDLGRELVALHLMEKHPAPATGFPITGDATVEAVRYAEPGQGSAAGRVWISKTQYFEGIPPEVWAFHVGGYQVCQKWLKDRKGRQLTYDDITHYQRICAALGETIRLMAGIDRIIDAHGGWPLK